MAGPFHHDVRGNAEGQGVDNEGAAAGVGSDQFPLGMDLVGADDFLLGEVDDLPLRHLQGRVELLIVQVGVVDTESQAL